MNNVHCKMYQYGTYSAKAWALQIVWNSRLLYRDNKCVFFLFRAKRSLSLHWVIKQVSGDCEQSGESKCHTTIGTGPSTNGCVTLALLRLQQRKGPFCSLRVERLSLRGWCQMTLFWSRKGICWERIKQRRAFQLKYYITKVSGRMSVHLPTNIVTDETKPSSLRLFFYCSSQGSLK